MLAKHSLAKADFDHVWKYFQHNCYPANPEWLLLAMLSDPNVDIRKLAVNKILELRKMPKTNEIRTYTLPILNDKAENYHQMINWDTAILSEPRPTMEISDSDLLDIGEGSQKLEDFIPKIICHR